MIHIKHYEAINVPNHSYWILPTDNRYLNSLSDIGCIDNSLRNIDENDDDNYNEYLKNNKFIVISYDKIFDWSWMPYDREDYYKKRNYSYKGLVNIHPSELLADKYNL